MAEPILPVRRIAKRLGRDFSSAQPVVYRRRLNVLDHMGFAVSDYARSKAFYEKSLAPLGFALVKEPMGEAAGFGQGGKASFWIEARGRPVKGRLHVAFEATSRNLVDAFHAAAIAAGGIDNGAPGVRDIYHPDYYGAYVLDPDGNNIEAVCHESPG